MIEIEADPYDNDGEDESGDECTMSFFLGVSPSFIGGIGGTGVWEVVGADGRV